MTQEERDNILLSILHKQDKMETRMCNIEKEVSKIASIEKEVLKIASMEKEVSKIASMEKEISKIEYIEKQVSQISEMKEEIQRINNTVLKIEYEHGQKLDALFDAFKFHSEKIYRQEERIASCENSLEKHDNEIFYLKSKVQGV